MPANLELKARILNIAAAKKIASNLTAQKPVVRSEIDTYFDVPRGRLKLREINESRAELIYYERANTKRSRYSNYSILPIVDTRGVKKMLKKSFGVRHVVRKKRIIYLYKNARIHLDTVRGFGEFIEFEVLVLKGRPQAIRLMKELKKHFGILKSSLIAGSYVDLLAKKHS